MKARIQDFFGFLFAFLFVGAVGLAGTLILIGAVALFYIAFYGLLLIPLVVSSYLAFALLRALL